MTFNVLLASFNVLLASLLIQTTASTTKIIFGSCSKVNEPQPLWPLIASRNPQLFAWLGDNIYSDRRHPNDKLSILKQAFSRDSDLTKLKPGQRPRFKPKTYQQHQEMYNQQKQIPEYALLSKTVPIIGTWDDHDCGINDADKYFSHKAERQQLHLDFLDVSLTDPRRQRQGVFNSYIVGRIKVILLDTRFHRDPWPWHPGAKDPIEMSDVLGEEQWEWLEKELTTILKNDIDLVLVGSGFQVLPVVAMASGKHETWYHFPSSKQRLIKLLSKSNVASILLSGDVHYAEVSSEVCTFENTDDTKRAIEFTSSGLTHAWNGPLNWPKPMPAPLAFRFAWFLWNFVGINPWRTHAYPGLNFGEIELLDQDNVVLRSIGVDNRTKFELTIQLNELIGGNDGNDGNEDEKDDVMTCTPMYGTPTQLQINVSKGLFLGIVLLFVVGILYGIGKLFWKCCCCMWRKRKDKKE